VQVLARWRRPCHACLRDHHSRLRHRSAPRHRHGCPDHPAGPTTEIAQLRPTSRTRRSREQREHAGTMPASRRS
jgi:hypothetical protein